jgi:hypothetical protein
MSRAEVGHRPARTHSAVVPLVRVGASFGSPTGEERHRRPAAASGARLLKVRRSGRDGSNGSAGTMLPGPSGLPRFSTLGCSPQPRLR